jgi:hypothetical protein
MRPNSQATDFTDDTDSDLGIFPGFSTVWKKVFHGVENPPENFPSLPSRTVLKTPFLTQP